MFYCTVYQLLTGVTLLTYTVLAGLEVSGAGVSVVKSLALVLGVSAWWVGWRPCLSV